MYAPRRRQPPRSIRRLFYRLSTYATKADSPIQLVDFGDLELIASAPFQIGAASLASTGDLRAVAQSFDARLELNECAKLRQPHDQAGDRLADVVA